MTTNTADVLSEQSNLAVVQMPGRRYPGSVIQGDSLFVLYDSAMDALEELRHEPSSEAFAAVLSLAEKLEERIHHYIEVCEASGIEWSFKLRRATSEYGDLTANDI